MEISQKRYQLFCKIMSGIDKSYGLITEYDSFPHEYGEYILYQTETHIIQLIGKDPGITVTQIASLMEKTTSACSQSVRKLCKKGWVKQVRNKENNREYNLQLTESGWNIFKEHEKFDQKCYQRNCEGLSCFSDKELELYIKIQEQINKAFQMDVDETKKNFSRIHTKKN